MLVESREVIDPAVMEAKRSIASKTFATWIEAAVPRVIPRLIFWCFAHPMRGAFDLAFPLEAATGSRMTVAQMITAHGCQVSALTSAEPCHHTALGTHPLQGNQSSKA